MRLFPPAPVRLFALAALFAATPVLAQTPGGDGAAGAVVLVPGHPDLALDEVDLQSQTLDIRLIRPMEHALGTVTEAVTHHDDGSVTVEMTAALTMPGGGGQQTRSESRYAWPSLAPISYTTIDLGDGDTGTVAFDGTHVTGAYGDDGAEPIPFDLTLDTPVFSPGAMGLVARAVPMREGYRAVASIFSADDRLEEVSLVVTGFEDADRPDGTTVSAAAVEVRRDGRVQRYLIDPGTRDLLMMTIAPNPNVLLEGTPR